MSCLLPGLRTRATRAPRDAFLDVRMRHDRDMTAIRHLEELQFRQHGEPRGADLVADREVEGPERWARREGAGEGRALEPRAERGVESVEQGAVQLEVLREGGVPVSRRTVWRGKV